MDVFLVYDSILEQYLLAGRLEFDFIDGDADLGIHSVEIDTINVWNEDNYNLFLTPCEKIDTLFYPLPRDTTNPPPWYTIYHDTKLDRVGQNRTIQGTISIIIYDLPKLDSMCYDFFIRDRAGNNSNIQTTDVFSTNVEIPAPEPTL
jgi:hypothetical protein